MTQAPIAAAILAAALLVSPALATTIHFDDASDGTDISTRYAAQGVTFNNPVGGGIFARESFFHETPRNVVSVFATGVPAFDARFGAVEAVFTSPQRAVSIDAAILRLPEGLGIPVNRPRLEIYDTSGAFLASVNWDFAEDPQPGAGGFAGWQTLDYEAPGLDIGAVRFLSTQPGDNPSNFGLFDNLVFLTTSFPGGPEPVPAPAGIGLLLLGLAGLSLARRR